jgi:hypothetical protein
VIIPASPGALRAPREQCARAACLVRPARFGFNAETAASNRFQQVDPRGDAAAASAAALAEFDALVAQLRAAGLQLCVVDDTPEPAKPDAVFPNNWVSFHADGTVVRYPMLTPNRRRERRPELIAAACRATGFVARRELDFTHYETQGRFLEGTGSLVLDHHERVAYANRSPRTDEGLLREWCRQMDYEPLVFDAATADGLPVYHTNVLLWIGERMAGVGSGWIAAADRSRVLARLRASGRVLFELPATALSAFAGNMLELATPQGRRILVLSQAAVEALGTSAVAALATHSDQLVVAAVPTIERLGGGSVRCMLAEVPV